jgi:superfamily II RNA helicase
MQFKQFVLDRFQEDAILAVERNSSVLVSSPTGSGKTLIADYIIDRDIQQEKRVIYTAPIKALSNQKYKDFTEQYGVEKIGLITGDIVINSTAPVLIMTAEIYRNMTVVKDPMLDDVSYCIMDEVHYISDEERGYIWEESIIFSPENIRFLFLSATIPNADEFASWVERIKRHKVSVIKHDVRPVPLDRKFYDAELGITNLAAIKEKKDLDRYPAYGQFGKRQQQFRKQKVPLPDFRELVSDLRSMEKLPCIYFVFSRVKTQEYAVELAKRFDFLSGAERSAIIAESGVYFRNLSPEILALKSVQELRQCMPRGVAFHNAGMLPDVKHVVEKLFAFGLIKVLFATETFAVGINMPAKTVCFDSLRKFTKSGFRYLTSKEYFQISGRAGRRGIDLEGLSVAVVHRPTAELDKIEQFTGEDILPLKSQFRLTYNTVLNMVHLHTPAENQTLLQMNFFTYQQLRGKSNGNRVLGSIKARFTKAVNTLTHEGYIKDGRLTKLGVFATKIFSDELEVAQLFEGEFSHPLDEYSILLIVSALNYEGKGMVKFHKTHEVSSKLLHAIYSNPILKRGDWHGNLEKMTSIIYPCYHHKRFLEILENVSMPEGDLIRIFMRIMDKLEQIDKAIIDNEHQRQLVRNCRQLIRDALEGIHVF